LSLELKDIIGPIVAGLVAGATALLSPFLQHKYWTRQKLFDLRVATINEANSVFARLSDLKSRDDSNPLDTELPVSIGELVTKVQTLFGDELAAHYNSTISSLVSIRRPDAAFIFEAKKLRDTTLFKMYQMALKGEDLPSNISPGYPTLP
jgi:hypothetical protein